MLTTLSIGSDYAASECTNENECQIIYYYYVVIAFGEISWHICLIS